MYTSFDSHMQFGSNAICPADQDGILVSGCLQIENTPETTDLGIRPRPLGPTNRRFDPLHEGVTCIDGHPRACVGQAFGFAKSGSKSPAQPVDKRVSGKLYPLAQELPMTNVPTVRFAVKLNFVDCGVRYV